MKARLALLVIFALSCVQGGRKERARHKRIHRRRFPKPETWMLYSSKYDPIVEENGCIDLRGPKCEYFANQPGYCHYWGKYMKIHCRKSCKWCQDKKEDRNPDRSLTQPLYNGGSRKSIINGGCEDLLEDCSKYIRTSGDCDAHRALTTKYCARTCGHCCSDQLAECSLFIKHPSQCNNLNGFFRKYCAQTCKFCGPPRIPVKKPDCADEISECRSFRAEDCRVHEIFTRKYCSKTCGYCEPLGNTTKTPIIVKTNPKTNTDFPLILTESVTLPPDADGSINITTAQPVTTNVNVESTATESVTSPTTKDTTIITITRDATRSSTDDVTSPSTESVTSSSTEDVTTDANENEPTAVTTTVKGAPSTTDSVTTSATEYATSPGTEDVTSTTVLLTTAESATSAPTTENVPTTPFAEDTTSPITEKSTTTTTTSITEDEETTTESAKSPATEDVQTTSASEEVTSPSTKDVTTATESTSSVAIENVPTTSPTEHTTISSDGTTSTSDSTSPATKEVTSPTTETPLIDSTTAPAVPTTEDVSASTTAPTVGQTDSLVTATETITDASFKTNSPVTVTHSNESGKTVTHATKSGKPITHASESGKTVHVATNPLIFTDTESRYGTAELVLGTPVTIPYVPEVTAPPTTLEATTDGNAGKTRCQQMMELSAAKPALVGAFYPACKENGEFEEKQCWGSTGYCWCVDKDGNEITGTKVQFKQPNCGNEETAPPTTTKPSTVAVTEDMNVHNTKEVTEPKRQKDIPATEPTHKTKINIKSTTKTRSIPCKDRLQNNICEKLVAKNPNFCTNHVNYMIVHCRKSCNFCGPTVQIPRCRDKRKRKCEMYSKFQGYCTVQKEHMAEFCPKSCGFCGVSPEELEKKISYMVHNEKYEFAIKTKWDGSPINHDPIKFKLSAEDSLNVRLEVSGPFFDQPGKPPCLAGQPCWKLWDYEVAEVFFLGENEKYLELEVSPHGPHLLLLLDGVRKPFKTKLPMRYSAVIDHNKKTWNGTAIVPIDYFPPNMRKINAYAIHGPDGSKVYESLYPAKNTSHPDFHQLQFFQDFDFKSMFNQGWKQPMSPFWIGRL